MTYVLTIIGEQSLSFQHLLVSNKKKDDFCKCAGITHCLTAKVSNIHFKTKVQWFVSCQPLNSSG